MTGLERLREIQGELLGYNINANLLGRGSSRLFKMEDEIESAISQAEREQSEDHEIAEWVRKHGGFDGPVKIDNLVLTGEAESAAVKTLRELSGAEQDEIETIGSMRSDIEKRLMPIGIEWPRFEDGERVQFGDEYIADDLGLVCDVCSIAVNKDGEFDINDTRFCKGERVKRPKQDPIGADGLHIHDDETVYLVDGNGEPLYVIGTKADGYQTVFVRNQSGYVNNYDAQRLTHTKPEPPDSAERIADDIKRMAEEWCSYPKLREASEKAASSVGEAGMGAALSNLSKRCRALAERERGE